MGDDPLHRTGPGGVPAQGRTTDHGEAAPAASGWELGLPSARDGNARGGIQRDGGLCAKEAEYGRAIHRDATDYGPLRGDGADARDVGGKKVVGTGGPGPGGSKGGGSRRREGRGKSGERGGGVAVN